ncbi:MAG: PAS domain S-box protein [Armatimonadota bacterium]
MNTTLRLLIIEDSEEETLRIVRELERGGYDVVFERVDTPEAMTVALTSKIWDVIITGYSMPRFNGLEALRLLREKGSLQPFILISGKIGENAVAEALKSGADDYVNRDNLAQLVPAVQRVVREAIRRKEHLQADNELRQSERLHRQLIETALEGVWLLDSEWNTTFLNKRVAEMLGCTIQELMGRPVFDFMYEDDLENANIHYERRKQGIAEIFDFRFRRKDGSELWTLISTTPIFDDSGKFAGSLAMLTDITDRKHAEKEREETEAKYQILAEESLLGVYIIQDRKFVYVNPRFAEMTGYTREELIGKMSPLDITAPESRNMVEENLRRRLTGEVKSIHYILKSVRKDGSTFDMEVIGSRAVYMEKPAILGSVLDITERKRAEEALEEERNLFVAGPTVVFKWRNEEGWPVEYISPNVKSQFGYTPEDLTSGIISYSSLIHPDDLFRVAMEVMSHSRSGVPYFEQEYRILRSDGEYRWIHDFTMVVRDSSGNITHYHGYVVDMTDRKHAEEELKEAEAKYRILAEESLVGVYIIQDGKFVYLNPRFAEMLGYTREELVDKVSPVDIVAPEDRATAAENIRRRMAGEIESVHYTLKWLRKDGTTVDGEVIGTLAAYRGKPAIIGLFIDITERIRAEERHLELENQQRQFYRQTILSATGGKLIISEPYEISELDRYVTKTYPLRVPADLETIRIEARNKAIAYGMPESRAGNFALCVGEAATNALKHAGGGEVALIHRDDRILARVSDHGHGMDALVLPLVTLERGYSTTKSLGMGYAIILSIADHVFLNTGPLGTKVVIEMDINPRPPVSLIETLPDTW